jgi:hypothetical protein
MPLDGGAHVEHFTRFAVTSEEMHFSLGILLIE